MLWPDQKRRGYGPSSLQSSYPMNLRLATVADIPAIVALEGNPLPASSSASGAKSVISATLTGGDARYYVSENPSGDIDGLRHSARLRRGFPLHRVEAHRGRHARSGASVASSLPRSSGSSFANSALIDSSSTCSRTTPAHAICTRVSDSSMRASCAKPLTATAAGSTCISCRCSNLNTTDMRHSALYGSVDIHFS